MQFSWNNTIFQEYNKSLGIIPPLTDGTYNLTFKIENNDNVQLKLQYIITIDNSGPIITLLNRKGNNSIINYQLLPIFSFSERLKFIR